VRVDGVFSIVKIEGGVGSCQVQVGFVEGANGTDVTPVSVKIITIDGRIFDGMRNDIFTKIVKPGVSSQ
jgi:hypothetical protein